MYKELVEYIVQKIVERPESVSITEEINENIATIKVRVAPEDLGKVIGKEGRTARSIRTLVYAAANKQNQRAILEILK